MCDQGQEKWSSVRITESKKNSMKIENHISVHSNLNLNGLIAQDIGLGKEVNLSVYDSVWDSTNLFIVFCVYSLFSDNTSLNQFLN